MDVLEEDPAILKKAIEEKAKAERIRKEAEDLERVRKEAEAKARERELAEVWYSNIKWEFRGRSVKREFLRLKQRLGRWSLQRCGMIILTKYLRGGLLKEIF